MGERFISDTGSLGHAPTEGGEPSAGPRELLRSNVAVASALGDFFKSSFGPRGLCKVILDEEGGSTITNHGATLLKAMGMRHPVGRIVLGMAGAVEGEVGDGVKACGILTASLLEEAERLVGLGVHPTLILSGYRTGLELALKTVKGLARAGDLGNQEFLEKVAATAMTGRLPADAVRYLAGMAARAAKKIALRGAEGFRVDVEKIRIVKGEGGSLLDSVMVEGGLILPHPMAKLRPNQPRRVRGCRVAVCLRPLEILPMADFGQWAGRVGVRVSTPELMRGFIAGEREIITSMFERLRPLGANVLLCERGVDDRLSALLGGEGVLAVKRIPRSDLVKIAQSTGATPITELEGLEARVLGACEEVRLEEIGGRKYLFVEGCSKGGVCGILLRGGDSNIVEMAESSLKTALSALKAVSISPFILPGGGAAEVEISRAVREAASKILGRSQLALEALARAVEVIPRTLAESADLDPVGVVAELLAEHGRGGGWVGVGVEEGRLVDMGRLGVYEPLGVKVQVLKSAVEAAGVLFRVDRLLPARERVGAGRKPLAEEEVERAEEAMLPGVMEMTEPTAKLPWEKP